MFRNSDVKAALEKLIEEGYRRFAIYPFGDNGCLVKNLLKEYFGIEAAYVVDNKYTLYNADIISFADLVKKEDQDYAVILTAEDKNLNKEIRI